CVETTRSASVLLPPIESEQRSPLQSTSDVLRSDDVSSQEIDDPRLRQTQVARPSAGKYLRELRRVQSIQPREQSAEHGAVLVQHRVVAVLEEAARIDGLLFADDAAAADAAAKHPVDAAVAVVGAAVAVLAEGAAEFTEHDHHRSPPLLAHLVGEGGQPAAEIGQLVGQRAGGTALPDVRVPTTHVDEAELHTLLHQARDAPSFHGEALASDRIATGTFHLLGHLAADLAAYLEAPAHRRRQPRARLHAHADFGLPLVRCRLAH